MIDYSISDLEELVIGRAISSLSVNDLNQHTEELLKDPKFLPGMNGLYDFSGIEMITGSPNEFVRLADSISDKEQIPVRAKVAVVCELDSSLHKALIGYRLMVSNSAVEYEFFSSEQAARSWLARTDINS
ncbi:hypothetical protein HII17_09510 [Thalassotalea sp. M1531]|uniref:STAS/SEC14 domain-containing protein n=1 Tax=Thalassotalea algicola TaxID=2716224 RepID=A0A7Y0LC07_9GAMM|nr:hypothetical protein [Thalassotalea algicola]NMP31800.1 hypothetical protein [Thalassotalea algicola]